MPKEDWIQIKTKDDIEEKQGDDQNNEHMARLEKQKLERKQVKWETGRNPVAEAMGK